MSETPSDRARELLRGAFDTHMHISPDVVERIIDDISLARRSRSSGWRGSCSSRTTARPRSGRRSCARRCRACRCSARSRSTAPSAASTRSRSRSPRARAPAPSGCRRSTRSTSPTSATAPPGAKVPVWVKLQLELREQGIEIPPVPVVDAHGALLPEVREVLGDGRPARAWCLATGHLGRDEIFTVVDAAVDAGVETIVITHPEFPSQDLSVDDQIALAARAPCSSAASRRRTRARSRGSSGSRTSAPPAPSTRCCRPISGRSSTRRSRTGWR